MRSLLSEASIKYTRNCTGVWHLIYIIYVHYNSKGLYTIWTISSAPVNMHCVPLTSMSSKVNGSQRCASLEPFCTLTVLESYSFNLSKWCIGALLSLAFTYMPILSPWRSIMQAWMSIAFQGLVDCLSQLCSQFGPGSLQSLCCHTKRRDSCMSSTHWWASFAHLHFDKYALTTEKTDVKLLFFSSGALWFIASPLKLTLHLLKAIRHTYPNWDVALVE